MKNKRIVVKVGSSTITYENGKSNLRRIECIARVLSDLQNAGHQMILVSSGAIAVGVGRLGLSRRPKLIMEKQATAAVGQCDLMFMYDKFFGEYNIPIAQILLTRDIVEDEYHKENTLNTFECLLKMGVIPIVNENDTVSGEESVFGDNDHLSSIVANLCSADLFIMLTDTDGFFDSDPHKNEDAKIISRVEKITSELYEAAGGAGSKQGTGGMRTKLEAADYATKHGITTVILSGEKPEAIYDLLEGKTVGTTFLPAKQ